MFRRVKPDQHIQVGSNCPNIAELKAFLRGLLSHAHQLRLEKHLSECDECRRLTDALTTTEEKWLQKPGYKTSDIHSPALFEAMETLKLFPPPKTSRTPFAEELAVQRLGDYDVLNELGRGGMGIVYRARHRRLKRDVALKVILAGKLASTADVRRFQVEAEAAAMLHHPNIVPIYEIGEQEGHHFFSMKWMEGGSLAERMRGASAEVAPTPREIAVLMKAICRAVSYAHRRGVLHRDLKPDNILLDAEGSPYVADFGLARLADNNSTLTRSIAIMGSPNYMAPEVAAGHARDATTAADVYSLGAMLYELLSGRPPFESASTAKTIRLVLEADPVSPSILNPRAPPDLVTICLKCLEKETGHRYSTAAEIAEELERFLRGEPIQARPISWSERCWRWAKREPMAAGSVATIAVVLALAFSGITWKWSGEIEQRLRAESESARAQSLVNRLQIERAESLFEAGDSSKALAHLARLLRERPQNRTAAERLMSELSYRSFSFPLARLPHAPSLNTLTEAQKHELRGRFLLSSSVRAISFSPNGQFALTASADGKARLWNTADGSPAEPPMHHDGEIVWARISPDNYKVATASVDRTAKLWSISSRQMIAPPLPHRDIVHSIEFSPDTRHVVTASRDRTARVWSASTGAPASPLLLHSNAVYFACFSPDAKWVLTADEGNRATLWDSETGAWHGTMPHFDFRGYAMSQPLFTKDSMQIVTLYGYEAVLRNRVPGFPEVRRFGHESYVGGAAFSPDTRCLATFSLDATLRFWDVSTGRLLFPPARHGHAVSSLNFSDDGQVALTAAGNNRVLAWNARSGTRMGEPLAHGHEVRNAVVQNQRQRAISTTSGDTAWLWDMRLHGPLSVLRYVPTAARFARFSGSGSFLAVINEDEEARIWNLQNGEDQTPAVFHTDHRSIRDVQFSPDDRFWATASEDGSAQVWHTETGERAGPKLSHSEMINRISFSPNGKLLVTASNDDTARLWDVESGALRLELKLGGNVNDARFSPDGKVIITACGNGTAVAWDAITGQQLFVLRHQGSVQWSAFDPAGLRVVTGSQDNTARIWSARTGSMMVPPLIHADSLHRIINIGFSPDGRRLATVAGSMVQVWDLETGQAVIPPISHHGLVHSAEFSPDGRLLLTASEDGTARLWDPNTGHALGAPIRHGSRVTSATFSPNGSHVLTCSSDRGVRFEEIISPPLPVPQWLPDLAEALAGQRFESSEVSTVIPVDQLFALRQRLKSNTGTNYYDRWARWFFAETANRTISPSSKVTVNDYIQRRITENTIESLTEAIRICGTNPVPYSMLSLHLLKTPHTHEDADWFSHCATNIAPTHPDAVFARQIVTETLSPASHRIAR